MSAERLESGERKCIRMGLICPCGTTSEHEVEVRKTACAGVSTQELKDSNKKHHHKRHDSPSKRPLVASGDSTDSFRKLESHHQSRGISCTPGEIKKTTRERTKKSEQKKERRSRSSSSHHDRTNHNGQGQMKHHHRQHSYDGSAKNKKSATLTKGDDRHHKHYGGTDVTKLAETRMAPRPHSTKPCKEKPPKEKSLPAEKSKTLEKCQAEEGKKSRKPRPKPPAYVIPVASSLK